MIVDTKVIVMDKLRSPLYNNVQKLLALPPGEQPSVNRPKRCRGLSSNNHPTQNENCNNRTHLQIKIYMQLHLERNCAYFLWNSLCHKSNFRRRYSMNVFIPANLVNYASGNIFQIPRDSKGRIL